MREMRREKVRERETYRGGGHFTQRSLQEVSHQGDQRKARRLFHRKPNGAARRGEPSRRQYPPPNAIWDDFPPHSLAEPLTLKLFISA